MVKLSSKMHTSSSAVLFRRQHVFYSDPSQTYLTPKSKSICPVFLTHRIPYSKTGISLLYYDGCNDSYYSKPAILSIRLAPIPFLSSSQISSLSISSPKETCETKSCLGVLNSKEIAYRYANSDGDNNHLELIAETSNSIFSQLSVASPLPFPTPTLGLLTYQCSFPCDVINNAIFQYASNWTVLFQVALSILDIS